MAGGLLTAARFFVRYWPFSDMSHVRLCDAFGGIAEVAWDRMANATHQSPSTFELVYLLTSGQPPSDSGRNASSAGMVARTLK